MCLFLFLFFWELLGGLPQYDLWWGDVLASQTQLNEDITHQPLWRSLRRFLFYCELSSSDGKLVSQAVRENGMGRTETTGIIIFIIT